MEVNLNALQDAGATAYSGALKPGGLSVSQTQGPIPTDVKSTANDKASAGMPQNPEQSLSKDEWDMIAKDVNKFMESLNANIKFSIHEKSGRLIMRVMDADNQVLKEFPPHELLDTLAAISQYVGGLLDKKV